MVTKLTQRELQFMGLAGQAGVDYRQVRDTVELIPYGAFLLDNPGQALTGIKPGDTVVIWTNAQLNPERSLVGAEAHPRLTLSGMCSYPRFFTEDHRGPVSMLFKCEQEIDITELSYFIKIFSLGVLKQ